MAVVDFDIIDIHTQASTDHRTPLPGLCDGARVYALCTRLAFTFPRCYVARLCFLHQYIDARRM